MSGTKNYATIKAIPVVTATRPEIVSVPHDRVQGQEDREKTRARKMAGKSAQTDSTEHPDNSKRANA